MDFQSMMNEASMGGGGPGAGVGGDQPQHDNAEMIYISSLALLKVSRESLFFDVGYLAYVFFLPSDAQAWTSWCTNGSHGSHAWRICR